MRHLPSRQHFSDSSALDVWWCWQSGWGVDRAREVKQGERQRLWGRRPEEVLFSFRRKKEMCQTGEHKRGEGSENASLVVAYSSFLWSDSAGRAVNSQGETRRDGGASLVEHLHNSHPMWICPSLWERKREGANLTGREWKKECTEISSCDIFSLSPPFFFYTAHTMITCSQCGGS